MCTLNGAQPNLCNEGQALAFLLTPLFQGSESVVSLVWLAFGHHLSNTGAICARAGRSAEPKGNAIMTFKPHGANGKTPTPMKGLQRRLRGSLHADQSKTSRNFCLQVEVLLIVPRSVASYCLHNPPAPRNVGMPDSADVPAPIRKMQHHNSKCRQSTEAGLCRDISAAFCGMYITCQYYNMLRIAQH